MSIDKALQDRVNTYGTNPAALQKRYQQSQKLIDLLALQQVKSDMQNARNSIMASMQNNPNTIAAQRENEVLGMAKEDVGNKVKQTAGVLNTKQRQQQAQMKKLMGLANKLGPAGINALMNKQSPQMNKQSPPVNPAMTGIAKAPAQNMQGITRAAKGGIIGFQDTGSVPDLSWVTNETAKQQIIDYINEINAGSGSAADKAAQINSFLEKNKGAMLGQNKTTTNQVVVPTFTDPTAEQTNQMTVADDIKSHIGDTSSQKYAAGILDAKDSPLDKIQDSIDFYKKQPQNIGYNTEVLEGFKDRFGGLESLYAAQQDPGRLSRDRWRQMLLGAATTDNPGVGIMTGRGKALAQQDKAAQLMGKQGLQAYTDIVDNIYDRRQQAMDFATGREQIDVQRTGQALVADVANNKAITDGLTADGSYYYSKWAAENDFNLKIYQQKSLEAINAASDHTKSIIANLQADTALKNMALQQDTNRLLAKMDSNAKKEALYTEQIRRYEDLKVEAEKTIRTQWDAILADMQLKANSMDDTVLIEKQNQWGTSIISKTKRGWFLEEIKKVEEGITTQIKALTDPLDDQIDILEEKQLALSEITITGP
tara:strand:- start:7730 stop:9517 length:1788 start_codon:yes stop_codon:yes gene_type:complete